MTPILECKQLTKRYGSLTALDNITLTVPKGKVVGLLGPNGSGKTTLLKLAAGLLAPTKGEIFIDGLKPGKESKAIVSYLPDRLYFGTWMTVEKCLDYFEDFYQDFDRERAEGMLNQLAINPKAAIKTLSKGTKEKVQLILVMSRKAQLYLLDEPIAGVDPAARDYILGTIINNYNYQGTVIISTHLISDIERILDGFLFLKNGSAVMSGDVEETREKYGKSIDELFKDVFRMTPYEGYGNNYEEKGEVRDDIKTIEV